MLPSALIHLWEKCVKHSNSSTLAVSLWQEATEALYALGIGMEETLHFLYQTQPSIETFTNWIEQRQLTLTPSNEDNTEFPLSEADIHFFKTQGYIVIPNAIPQQDVQKSCQAIWSFLNMDSEDATTWYRTHEGQKGMMLTLSNHPALNKNRMSLRIKYAYEQLYSSKAIYKTIDKVSFNPPIINGQALPSGDLHWDISLALPIPFTMQGLLYLTDCGPNDGAFHCVPGFHLQLEDWLTTVPNDTTARNYAPQHLQAIPITGKAGDFIIWNSALPHCAGKNFGTSPRMVQYLTYKPKGHQENAVWI